MREQRRGEFNISNERRGEIGEKSQGRSLGKSVNKNWNLMEIHCCVIPIPLKLSLSQKPVFQSSVFGRLLCINSILITYTSIRIH